MKLTLDRIDLKPEFRDINCSQTMFSHFKDDVQTAIVSAGGATFWEYDRRNYNAILIPIDQRINLEGA